MNRNSNRIDWFFPIEEASVFDTVTHKGVARAVRVPHKKALIAADTGDILSNNTMIDIASRPPQSPSFRRDHPARSTAVLGPGCGILTPARPVPDSALPGICLNSRTGERFSDFPMIGLVVC